MRVLQVCVVLTVTAATASAEPCELAIDVHGALVDATLRERVLPGPAATALDYELPAGARLVGFELRGKHGAGAAVAVPASPQTEEVTDASVLGPDPAFVTALADSDAGRPRFRAIVEPIAAGSDVVAVARWTAIADIRGGELHLVVPASTLGTCKATVRAQTGAGASVARIRVGAAATRGASASFELADSDVELAIELGFARSEPIAWVQREPLGDGTTAEAVTVIAPPAATLARTHRAVLVIDTSRSMELIGRPRVTAAIHAVVDALPPGSQIGAIAFDRTPAALFDGWKPTGPEALAALDQLLAHRPAGNGSDLAGALVLAHNALANVHEPAIVVAITDSALGDADAGALARALGDGKNVDLHAIVLDFAGHAAPGRTPLLAAIDRAGGSLVELPADDRARPATWLEPAWFGLALAGTTADVPAQLRAGDGFVRVSVTRAPQPITLAAHDETGKVAIAATAARASEVAMLSERRPHVDGSHALAVLATGGRVARDRRSMIAGGGPFTRMIAAADPAGERPAPVTVARAQASGLDRELLQRLFELQLQPKAYQCYQHALSAQVAANKPPTLAGTVRFSLELGRGEVTRAQVAGLGDSAFDACLLDAAYALVPPTPTADTDPDDRTLASYPLTFALRPGDKPVIVAGDADSSSPLDIEHIHGGAARPDRLPRVDTVTPLGGLKPSP